MGVCSTGVATGTSLITCTFEGTFEGKDRYEYESNMYVAILMHFVE